MKMEVRDYKELKGEPKAKVHKMHIPSELHIDEEDLPDIADWKVGASYEIKLKVLLKSLKKDDPMLIMEGDTDAEKIHAVFEVMEAESEEGREKESEEN